MQRPRSSSGSKPESTILPADLMKILRCPTCTSELKLRVLSTERRDALLQCPKDHYYPVTTGLPRILPAGLEANYSEFESLYARELQTSGIHLHQQDSVRAESKQMQEAFRDKWTSKDKMGIDSSSPYSSFMRRWMLRKYGWKDEVGFTADIAGRKLILDAGAGLGREVINFAKAADNDSVIIGLELSGSAENAFRNVAPYKNACIIQGDILTMPFAEDSFDYILSEGVLHHTPNTREAFVKCSRHLKKGGVLAFYLYKKKGPIREFADDYIREIMQKATSEEQWRIARNITSLGRSLSEVKGVAKVTEDFPELGIRKSREQVQRFIYWNFLKCFWNDELPFDENVIINFDWYAPKHAHRHTEAEIREWCAENALDIVWFFEEESGFTVRAKKN